MPRTVSLQSRHQPIVLRLSGSQRTKPLLSRPFIADPNAALEAAHSVAKRFNELSENDCLW
jgi:hypothetical protein